MRVRAIAFRVLRITTVSLLALLLLAFALVQFQQHLLRRRAERLLADFHSIRLNQTTWPEAEAIMHRWGSFVYTKDACSADSCVAVINLADASRRTVDHLSEAILDCAVNLRLVGLYELLGGRPAKVSLAMAMQDGRVVNASFLVTIEVHKHWFSVKSEESYMLGIRLQSVSSFGTHDPWSKHRLAAHPDYDVTSPHCYGCEFATVRYSTALAAAELDQLSAFHLDCITRTHACTSLPELLPYAAAWHLYEDVAEKPAAVTPASQGCNLPLRALGREAIDTIEVEALSAERQLTVHEGAASEEQPVYASSVRLLDVLHGSVPWRRGEVFDVIPYRAEAGEAYASEPMTAGTRYILLLNEPPVSSRYAVGLEWCGVLEDSAAVLWGLREGFRADHAYPQAATNWW